MIGRWYSVCCDNCGLVCGGASDMRDTAAEARRVAKRRGWLRIPRRPNIAGGSPGRDFCPACTKSTTNQEGTTQPS